MTTPELSKFLEPEEKESVLKAISDNEKVMASGVCNVLTNNNGDWVNSKPGTAVALFLNNSSRRYFRILVVEPSSEAEKAAEIQLDYRIRLVIIITKIHAKLIAFKNDNGEDIGLQFHNSKECEQFHESISNRRSWFRKSKKQARIKKSESFCEDMTGEQKNQYHFIMGTINCPTPEDKQFVKKYVLKNKQAVEENKRESTTEASTSSLENIQRTLELNLPTLDNSSKVTEQSTVTNLAEPVPAEVDPVETSDPTEKKKKVDEGRLERMGAVRMLPNIAKLSNKSKQIGATSDEGSPSDLAHQEHVPEIMPDTTSTPSVPAHLPSSGPSELAHQENLPELMPDPTSTPPIPAHRACWTVPKDPVPDNGLQHHNSKDCEQFRESISNREFLLPSVKIDEQGTSQFVRGGSVRLRMSKREARKQRSQSMYDNLTEERRKQYQDIMNKFNFRTPGEKQFASEKLLEYIIAEEEKKRKSAIEALMSSLENSQRAPELNLPTAVNWSEVTEQSAVTNLAEPVPAEVDASDEEIPSELAHQEPVPELMSDPTSEPPAPTPRACWTIPNGPESPLESPQQLEPVVETEYEKYFAETEGTDAILIVKGKKLHVNKKFLSHRSEYFSRLFISIGKEYPTELVEHEDLAILLSLLMPESFSLIGTNAETLLELADRFKLAAAKPHLEQFIIGSDMDRFEKIRIGEKHQLEELLKNGIMEFNEEDVISQMELNPSYKTISDRVKFQILSRVLRMKE